MKTSNKVLTLKELAVGKSKILKELAVKYGVDTDTMYNVHGDVLGDINGRVWMYEETPKEKVARLIREGKSEEAIQVMENEL